MIELGATLNSHRAFITEKEKKEYQKEWNDKKYQNKKTEIIEKVRNYRQNNKTKISEKAKVKVNCNFCNCEVNKSSLNKHQKTLKCMKFREFIDLE